MSILKPKALVPGSTISIVTPASPVIEDQMGRAIRMLEDAGYRVKTSEHWLGKFDYLSGSDSERAADLRWAFEDPEADAVYCSRGGYGCARLLPYLDFDQMARSEKMFLGFSDITTLHLALNRRGLVTFNAPMALTLHYDREPWVYESFFKALRGEDPLAVESPRAETLTPGRAVGRTTGGCLCLLCDSIGTKEALETAGKILLIEDVDEAPHRVDALLTHLRNTNLLQQAAGIVVGEMTRTDEKVAVDIGGRNWREIVAERVGDLGIPAVMNFPFGHMKTMLSVPFGVNAELDADAGTLRLLESTCR